MRQPISKDTLLSITDAINPADQITRIKLTVKSLPLIAGRVQQVLQAAPYLVVIYVLYGLIDFIVQINPQAEVTGFTTLITLIIAAGAITLTYIETYNTLSNNSPIQTPWRYALFHLPQLIGAAFTTAFLIFAGLALFVLPGAYLSIRLLVSLPATVLNRGGIRSGLRESFSATTGQLTLIMVIGGVLTLGITLGLAGFSATRGILRLGFAFLLSGPLQLLTHILLAIIYLNGSGEGEQIIPDTPVESA